MVVANSIPSLKCKVDFNFVENILPVVNVIHVALTINLSSCLVSWDTNVSLLVAGEVSQFRDVTPVIHFTPKKCDAHILKP